MRNFDAKFFGQNQGSTFECTQIFGSKITFFYDNNVVFVSVILKKIFFFEKKPKFFWTQNTRVIVKSLKKKGEKNGLFSIFFMVLKRQNYKSRHELILGQFSEAKNVKKSHLFFCFFRFLLI